MPLKALTPSYLARKKIPRTKHSEPALLYTHSLSLSSSSSKFPWKSAAMATPTPDAVQTFMRITGASEFVAVRTLEEYGGNLNEAVNAYFIEGDRRIPRQNFGASPQYSHMDVSSQNHAGSRGLLPLFSAARRFRPSLLLDPNYRRELRELYNSFGATPYTSHAPYNLHPEVVREVPVGINSAFEQPHHSGMSSTSVDVTGRSLSHGQGIYGREGNHNNYNLTQSNTSNVLNNDIEEEMIQAAIEASKQGSPDAGFPQIRSHEEDDDLAHALSLSLKMAEEEKAIREYLEREENKGRKVHDLSAKREKINGSKWEPGASSNQGGAQNVARPIMDHPLNHNSSNHLQGNDDVFISEEWGGISSDELNEAVLLENALFGEMSDQTSHEFSSLPHPQHYPERSVDPKRQGLSDTELRSLTATRLLREQQDADYLASLLADKEKEMSALKEAETHCFKEEESCKKIVERKEWEKSLDKKKVSLLDEPPLDDEKAITIVVRMPDGSRCARRFHKTDKLQLLFDFLDIGGALKPGTYRVVKSYPRRAYSIDDSSLALSEVGLTSRQEALFLELI